MESPECPFSLAGEHETGNPAGIRPARQLGATPAAPIRLATFGGLSE
jgi:hypothetical protein